jgi:uncharacterized protein with HEPN domain
MRGDIDRLIDIIEAIDAIFRHTSSGRAKFDADELVRVWCLRHIEVIGEAVSRLSPEMRDQHPVVPWRNIVAMRNALIHGYFDTDWEAVWAVVEHDLGPLQVAVQAMLQVETTMS